ncbi:MAG TPA: hypothetical protein VNF29_00295 [Candidatus Binataceae bacterium]|nr:hypothetical protein [Candidatus Binataceae bacterium]
MAQRLEIPGGEPLLAGAARIRLEPPLGLAMLGYGSRDWMGYAVDELKAQAARVAAGTGEAMVAAALAVMRELRAAAPA